MSYGCSCFDRRRLCDKIDEDIIEAAKILAFRDDDGNTRLHQARNVRVAKILLDAHADVEAVNKEGDTPLFSAILRQNLEIVDLLVARGANIEAHDDDGQTPLVIASLNPSVEIAGALLAAGADVNAVSTGSGNTPLACACMKGYYYVAMCLLSAGARTDIRNKNERLALELVPVADRERFEKLFETMKPVTDKAGGSLTPGEPLTPGDPTPSATTPTPTPTA